MPSSILSEIHRLDTGRKQLRSFGTLVGSVLVAIAVAVLWRAEWIAGIAVFTLAGIGGALIVLGLAAPAVLKPLYIVWMGLAITMGFVMTRIILVLVFFAVVTPIGLGLRLFGKDPLNRSLQASDPSYWITKEDAVSPQERLEKYY